MKQFADCAAFARHLEQLIVELPVFELVALEAIGVVVQQTAKDKIGHYQNEAGPFATWALLADSTLKDRTNKGFPADEPLLRTGDMRDSIEFHVIVPEVAIGSNDDIAVYQELGTVRMPPRSFLAGALFEKAPELVANIGVQLERYIAGDKIK